MSPKKEKTRLKSLEEMNADEKAAFEKKGAGAQAEYMAKLMLQTAQDNLDKVRADAEAEATRKRKERELTAGVRKIVAAVRAKELVLDEATPENDTVKTALQNIVITGTGAVAFNVKPPTEVRSKVELSTEELEAAYTQIKAEATKPEGAPKSSTPKIVAPTFTLSHSFALLPREAFVQPTDGGRPDAAIIGAHNRYGHILPFIATPVEGEDGLYNLLKGRRRFFLLKEGEVVPTVIVQGFPDEYTQEAAEIAATRTDSLNVLRAAEVIERSRRRGKTDSNLRSDMGFKTGEVDKYAALLVLPQAIRDGIRDGRVAVNTALTLARQPKGIQDKLAADFADRRAKETPSNPARLTEADVDAARSSNSEAAVKRDTPLLNALTDTVKPEDVTGTSTGEGTAQKSPVSAQKAGDGSKAGAGASDASSAAQSGGIATNKPLDNAAQGGVQEQSADGEDSSGAAWVEKALETLGETILHAMPQDAPDPIRPLYRKLRDALVEVGGGMDFATTPDDEPASVYKVAKKADVENTVAARTGWKAAVLKGFKPLREGIPVDAPPTVWAIFEELKAAVSSARPGATS